MPKTIRLSPIWILLIALLLAWGLASCTESDNPPEQPANQPLIATAETQPLRPTPTLAAGLPPAPTAVPPPITATLPADISPLADATDAASPTPQTGSVPVGITPPASPTPLPNLNGAEALALAQLAWHNGDTQTMSTLLSNTAAFPANQAAQAHYWLGRAYLLEGNTAEAVTAFRAQLESSQVDPRTHFHLGELNLAAGNCPIALQEYALYLEAEPELGAYIYPRIAQCQPDRADQQASYAQALASDAHYLVRVGLHRQLADLFLADSAYSEAIAQYEAIRNLAQTENTQGEMTYLMGATQLLQGETTAAYDTFRFGVANYPRSYSSYLGLVELVEAEQPVNQYQRGVVNYHAQVYAPSIAALSNYITTTAGTEPFQPDAHLWLAWSYEQAGDFANALAQMDAYLATSPEDTAVIGTYYEEKAGIETRSITVSQAIATLDDFIANHPAHEKVAWARWRTAQLADRFMGDAASGAARYLTFAKAHPNDERTAEAQFRAGTLSYEQGDLDSAARVWRQAATKNDRFGQAAVLWLILTLPSDQAAEFNQQVRQFSDFNYYVLRGRDLAQGQPAYGHIGELNFDYDEEAEKREVEAWLRAHFGLADEAIVQSDLADGLQNDARLQRGTALWQLGLFDEAKRELEAVRTAYANNAQLSYQLSLYFRDLGIYRSSILAANAVFARAGVSVFDAPKLIGRLAYPTYYADLVLPLAERYEYDPLLHFALVRQESLFEGFATSTAVAQGLGQVIPDTGNFIAQRLNWPSYQNSDLYRPYVNLTFSAYYLDLQLESFGGLTAAGLAAYNAGPGNASRWQAQAPDSHDFYLETVNFNETRTYIRNIYIWHAVYRYLYSG